MGSARKKYTQEYKAEAVHDFVDKKLGKANPYGVYDVGANAGWVSVGTDHDTAAFAVNTIHRECQKKSDALSRRSPTGYLDEVKAWQHRPLDSIYPVVFIDAMVAKVRDGQGVRSKAVNIAIGVDLEGHKHVLGIWVAAAEGAKLWAQALAQLRNPWCGGRADRVLRRPVGAG